MSFFWIDLFPINPVTGVSEALYYTSSDTPNAVYIHPNREYLPYMENYPTFSFSVFEGEFNGKSSVTVSDITVIAEQNILGYVWDGARVVIRKGNSLPNTAAVGVATVPIIFQGVVRGSPRLSDRGYSFSLVDFSYLLERDLLSKVYGGTGGIEGPEEYKGVHKPLAIGRVLAAEPVLINSGFLIFQYHGYGRAGGVTALSENGLMFEIPTAVIGWQGSEAATYDALKAVVLGLGQWADAPSIGCFRLGGEPVDGGVLVCDIMGGLDESGNLIEAMPAVIQYLCTLSNAPIPLVIPNADTFHAATRQQTIGDYLLQQTQLESKIAEYLMGAGAYYFFDSAARLSLGVVRISNVPDFTVNTNGNSDTPFEEVKSLPISAPYGKFRLGFNKCFRVHNTNEISDALKDAIENQFGGNYADLFNKPVTLADISAAEAAKLGGIEGGATRDVVTDTRDQNYPPAWYRAVGRVKRLNMEMKLKDVVGVTAAAGTYGTMETIAQWADPSGGPVWQRYTDSAGTRYIRFSLTEDSWSAWEPEYSGNRKPRFGEDLLEFAAGPIATNNNFKTQLGTAAAFFGQTPWATLLSPTSKINYLRTDGTMITGFGNGLLNSLASEWLTDNGIITRLGQAASFFGQGALATLSSLANGSPLLTGFGALSSLTGIRMGGPTAGFGGIFNEAQTEFATEGAYRTLIGIASAVTGQGLLATTNHISGDNQLAGNMALRLAPFVSDARFLRANNVAWAEGSTVQLLKPGEAGANVTEIRIASAIFGQGFGATAAQSLVDNRVVPVGENTVINSSWRNGLNNWRRGASAEPSATLGLNFANYFGKRNVAYIYAASLPDEVAIDVNPAGRWGGNTDQMRVIDMPVKAGDRLGARVLGSSHRSLSQLYLLVFNKDGGLVEAPAVNFTVSHLGGQDGDSFETREIIHNVTSPTAAYATIMIRMFGVAGFNTPYFFFSEPWLGKLASGQTVIPPYTPGPSDPRADQTLANTAAGFVGQGALATANSINAENQLGGNIATRLAPWGPDNRFLNANSVAWATGNTVEGLKPGEAGANVTEGRTAAAITGQSPFATTNQPVSKLSFLQPNGYMRLGVDGGLVNNGQNAWLTDGNTITAQGTAAAVNAQGTLATQDVVRLGSPSGRLGGLVSEANAFYVTDAVAVTSQGSAASFQGQGALATRSAVTYGDGYTLGFNYLATLSQVTLNTTTIRRADGSSLVSETLVVTEQGVAAAFAGQGALATQNAVGYAQLLIAELRKQDSDTDTGSYAANNLGQSVQATGLVCTIPGVQPTGDIYITVSGSAVFSIRTGNYTNIQDGGVYLRVTRPNGTFREFQIPAPQNGSFSPFSLKIDIPSDASGTHTVTIFARRGFNDSPPLGPGEPGLYSPPVQITNMTMSVIWRAL